MSASCGGRCSCSKDVESLYPDHCTSGATEECYRCHVRPATLFTRKASCLECFLDVFRRNFASNLRNRCLTKGKAPQSLVVVVNGNLFSTSLLHLLLNRNKRRYLKVSHGQHDKAVTHQLFCSDDITIENVISLDYYICGYGSNRDNANVFFKHVVDVINKTGNAALMHNVIASEDCLVEATVLDRIRLSHISVCFFLHDNFTTCNEHCSRLRSYIMSLYQNNRYDQLLYAFSQLQMENIRSHLKKRGLVNPCVVMCDSQEVIARRVMFLTCVEGGHMVSFKSSFVDNLTFNGLGTIIRPLKSFSDKEIAFYHRFNGLPDVALLDHYWHSAPQSCILGCINSFVESLKGVHNNTLDNVCKVVEKLEHVFPEAVKSCGVCHQAVYTTDTEVTLCVPCEYMCSKSPELQNVFSLMSDRVV